MKKILGYLVVMLGLTFALLDFAQQIETVDAHTENSEQLQMIMAQIKI